MAKADRWLSLPLLFLCFGSFQGRAQEMADTLYHELDDVEISGSRYGRLEKGGSIEFSRDQILGGQHVFGEADALKNIARLSGVVTGGDYGSGLMIDGNLPSHVLYRIDKVPVFFPYRFGGIFSTFNTGHFKSVTFERGIHGADMPARLGAKIDFDTSSSIPRQFSGLANVGLISSSLSFHLPLGSKFSVSTSARVSYLDQLYGRFLEKTDNAVKYNFQDFNLTANYLPSGANCIVLNAFYSSDNLKYLDSNYVMDTRMHWQNAAASLAWTYTGRVRMTHRASTSFFSNTLKLNMPQFSLSIPSAILSAGISGEIDIPVDNEKISINGGYEFNWYANWVQEAKLKDFNEREATSKAPMHPLEGRLFADVEISLPRNMKLKGGLSALLYANGSSFITGSADPRITLTIPVSPGSLSFHVGTYSQLLHQVGFSQMGLASDFWIASGKKVKPERSVNLEIDYTGYIIPISLYYSCNVYVRHFVNMAEYMGELLSVLDDDFMADNLIISCKGFASGINLQFRRTFGSITGSAGIGYGLVRIQMPGYAGYLRGRSDSGLTCSLELSYEINKHWTLGGDFKFSSGRPYTPVNSLYFIAGNLMKEYGAPNSSRLPAWHRLDLSATWKTISQIKSHRLTHMVSLGIINAYGRRNPEFLTYTLDLNNGKVALKTVASLYRFLPSLSYTIIF